MSVQVVCISSPCGFQTKKYADVIIPRGAENTVAIDLIVQHIQDLLRGSPVAVNGKNGIRNRHRHNSDSLVSRPH